MTTKEELIATRKVIERPEAWCQFALKNGKGAHCALGAFIATGTFGGRGGHLLREAMGGSIADFNNTHSHYCVLAAFDAAIEAA